MNKSGDLAKKTNPLNLDLPDWRGMDESPRRISIEKAFELCEEQPEWVCQEAARKWRTLRPEKCEVEFNF